MTNDIKLFKNCMSSFATGITIITSLKTNSEPIGITINSFSSLSIDPLLILFSLSKQSSIKDFIIKNQYFTVNILSSFQKQLSQNFASPGTVNWDEVDFSLGAINNCPNLENALAVIECKIHNIFDGGDHNIIIGKVLHMEKNDNNNPLIYYDRKYHKIIKNV